MRRLLAAGWACLLAWMAAAGATEPAVLPPVALPVHAPVQPANAAPGVSLGFPEPILVDLGPVQPIDPGIRTVGAQSWGSPVPSVVRAHAAEDFPRPLPVGPEGVKPPATDPEDADTPVSTPVGAEQLPAPRAAPADSVLTPFAIDPVGADLLGADLGERVIASRPTRRFWGKAEYLLWWIKDPEYPPLITTGPNTGTGSLAEAGTIVLFPGADGRASYGPFSGGRFSVGFWCDPCERVGIEGNYFFLAERSLRFAADSSQFPLLARPFFGLVQQAQLSEITARPDIGAGTVLIDNPSKLWGAEINFRCNLNQTGWSRLDFLAGFRYLQLDERLRITEVAQAFPVGTRIIVADDFRTRNQFYGGQVGFDWEWERNRWVVNVRGKVALGTTHQTVDIDGFQLFTPPGGGTAFFRGGLLALNPNIGRHNREVFSVVPEIGVNLGYRFTDNLYGWVGYNFLWWSNVLRPGDQLDPVLDTNQIPNGPPPTPPATQFRPTVPFKGTDFWAQGMNLGLEYRY